MVTWGEEEGEEEGEEQSRKSGRGGNFGASGANIMTDRALIGPKGSFTARTLYSAAAVEQMVQSILYCPLPPHHCTAAIG